MRVSVVIPTKNRHRELCTALESIAGQSLMPAEVLLIDQSAAPPQDSERARLRAMLGEETDLRWIHDPSVAGLVHAKSVGAQLALGDIVCFLEDDIVLEQAYVRTIRDAFVRDASLVGASGVVTNSPFGRTYARLHAIFHRGMFSDPRPLIYATLGDRSDFPIRSHALSGGLSAWRRQTLAEIPFDTANGFHMLEDLDFSTRVHARFGERLAILPGARLEHHFAPAGRASKGDRERRKVIEFITFYRTRPRRAIDLFWLAWLLVGVGMCSAASSMLDVSWTPLAGYVRGLLDGPRRGVVPIGTSTERIPG